MCCYKTEQSVYCSGSLEILRTNILKPERQVGCILLSRQQASLLHHCFVFEVRSIYVVTAMVAFALCCLDAVYMIHGEVVVP